MFINELLTVWQVLQCSFGPERGFHTTQGVHWLMCVIQSPICPFGIWSCAGEMSKSRSLDKSNVWPSRATRARLKRRALYDLKFESQHEARNLVKFCNVHGPADGDEDEVVMDRYDVHRGQIFGVLTAHSGTPVFVSAVLLSRTLTSFWKVRFDWRRIQTQSISQVGLTNLSKSSKKFNLLGSTTNCCDSVGISQEWEWVCYVDGYNAIAWQRDW